MDAQVPVMTPVLPDGKRYQMMLGQDATFGNDQDRSIPGWAIAEGDEDELRQEFREGVLYFAEGAEAHSMVSRAAEQFLSKQSRYVIWSDALYDAAIQRHENLSGFSEIALSAPGYARQRSSGVSIHGAIVNAGFDISNIKPVEDFGPPAFSKGSWFPTSEDYENGLKILVNQVSYIYIFATSYCYNESERRYSITLENHVFDTFGLDDADQKKFGGNLTVPSRGFTAWWRLQHQFGYCPPITYGKSVFKYEVIL